MGEMIETCEMTGRILDQKETIEKIQEMTEIQEMRETSVTLEM